MHQSVLAKVVGIVPGSIVAAVALACSASAGAATDTSNLSASASLDLRTGPFYEDASPFNTPVPANPQLAPNSSQIVQRVTGWARPQDPTPGPPAPPTTGPTPSISPSCRTRSTRSTRPAGPTKTSRANRSISRSGRSPRAEPIRSSASSGPSAAGSTTSGMPRYRAATAVRSRRISGDADSGREAVSGRAAFRIAAESPPPGSRVRPV